jgi:hypothetical protein
MVKFASVMLLLFMTSGCCEVFGICTSVHVNTSAESPDKFARLDMNNAFDRLGSSPYSGLRPTSTIDNGQRMENQFRACS